MQPTLNIIPKLGMRLFATCLCCARLFFWLFCNSNYHYLRINQNFFREIGVIRGKNIFYGAESFKSG